MRKVIGWGIALIGLGALAGFVARLVWPHQSWQELEPADTGGDIDPQTYPRS